MLAEDTIALQHLTTMLIEKTGAEVAVASNGVEALEGPYQTLMRVIQRDGRR